MEYISPDIVKEIISSISPVACELAIGLSVCEIVFQFFMRLAFPKRFNER